MVIESIGRGVILRTVSKIIFRAIALILSLGLACNSAHAFVEDTPARSAKIASSLSKAEWRVLEDGFEVLQAQTESGIGFAAFKISLEKFAFEIAVQDHPKGERAAHIGERLEAVLAVNGGFFGESKKGELFPVGLMSSMGVPMGRAWLTSGGYLVLGEKTKIVPSIEGMPLYAREFVQSKPVLIEPGGHWAMNTNSNIQKKRSLFCRLPDGDIIIALATGMGLSLFEAGWLMRAEKEGGFFGCDSAIAMDGGGSTQIWVAGHDELSYRGISPVHNFLIMKHR